MGYSLALRFQSIPGSGPSAAAAPPESAQRREAEESAKAGEQEHERKDNNDSNYMYLPNWRLGWIEGPAPKNNCFLIVPLKFGQISEAIVVGLKQETIICRPFLGALHFILFMPVPHLDQAYSTSSLSPLMVGQWTGGWSVVLRITRSNWVCFHFPSTSAIDLQKDTCLVLLSLLRINLLPNSYSMSCQSGQGRAGPGRSTGLRILW